MTTGLLEKRCSACRISKEIGAFGMLSSAKDGRTYACLDCCRAKTRKWRAANRNRDREVKKAWADKNKDKLRLKGQRYYAENREKHKISTDNWAKRNAPKVAARFAQRRAQKRNATPHWLTAIQRAQIHEFYEVAAAITMQTGVKHHVDHIVPLQGRGFSGLHVPWNLRVIPAHENHVKLNNPPTELAGLFWGDQA